MKQFKMAQTMTNEALSASINELTSKFDVIGTHQKAIVMPKMLIVYTIINNICLS